MDAVFWNMVKNNVITTEDVFNGIIMAGNRIGIKYLQPILDKRIRSEHYVAIFEKIGEYLVNYRKHNFTKKELESLFNNDEIHVFNSFIKRAKELKIIELTSSRKKWRIPFY